MGTLDTITVIHVAEMMNAILNGESNLAPYVAFQTTGGQLGKIDNYFYLAFGQKYMGSDFCSEQQYTHTIYQFSIDESFNVTIQNTIQNLDPNSGWRRRDDTLTPITINHCDSLFTMDGPFTPGADPVVPLYHNINNTSYIATTAL